MAQFLPGETKHATVDITISPAGLQCTAELFLTADGVTVAATSGQIHFTSTGADQSLQFTIIMPQTPGIYMVRLIVIAGGVQIASYQGTDEVVITSPTPSGAIFITAINTGGENKWSGIINDVDSNSKFYWPLQDSNIPIEVKFDNTVPYGRNILLYYLTEYTVPINQPPYIAGVELVGTLLIKLPSLPGTFVFDCSKNTLAGVKATDLANTNNLQWVKGVVNGAGDAGSYRIILFTFKESRPADSSHIDVGQYYLGRELMILAPPGTLIPRGVDGFTDCLISLSSSGWGLGAIRASRSQPDSYYYFNLLSYGATISSDNEYVTLSLSIQSNAPYFKVGGFFVAPGEPQEDITEAFERIGAGPTFSFAAVVKRSDPRYFSLIIVASPEGWVGIGDSYRCPTILSTKNY
jgi:hypothetical protein